jgi:hypothetical protein
MATQNQNLSCLLPLIQNCGATEMGAQEMEKLVHQAITSLEPLTKSTLLLLSIRAKAAQRGLQTNVVHCLKQYWLSEDKVNRMSLPGQARSQACLLLEQVIATAKKQTYLLSDYRLTLPPWLWHN